MRCANPDSLTSKAEGWVPVRRDGGGRMMPPDRGAMPRRQIWDMREDVAGLPTDNEHLPPAASRPRACDSLPARHMAPAPPQPP